MPRDMERLAHTDDCFAQHEDGQLDCICGAFAEQRVESPTLPVSQPDQNSGADSRTQSERDWRKMCIVEIAVENQSVSDYVEHWEGRAELAEKSLSEAREELARLKRYANHLASCTYYKVEHAYKPTCTCGLLELLAVPEKPDTK